MNSLLKNQQPILHRRGSTNETTVDFDPFAEGELLLTAPATASQTEIWASVQMGSAANCAYNELTHCDRLYNNWCCVMKR